MNDHHPESAQSLAGVPQAALPSFSVIVPTHRRATLLERTLSSLRAQANPLSLEVIVVSDCADAATDAVCYQWLTSSDTYIRRSGPPGPSRSRNLGLQLARGHVILFLDDDDTWHADLLASLQACEPLQKGQPIYFDCNVIKERRIPEGPQFLSEAFADLKGRLTEDVYIKNQIPVCCFAFPRSLLQGLEFDSHMRAYEDWDFLLSVFTRMMPIHAPILGATVHEVDDHTSDRRGSTNAAQDHNALLDYLYVYRRHKVSALMQEKRAQFLAQAGLSLPMELV